MATRRDRRELGPEAPAGAHAQVSTGPRAHEDLAGRTMYNIFPHCLRADPLSCFHFPST